MLTCGKRRLDVAEQLFVPLERQARDASRPATGSGRRPGRSSRRSSRYSVVAVEHVAVGVVRAAARTRRSGSRRADVGVVDVAVDVVGAIGLGMQPPASRRRPPRPAPPGRGIPAAAAPRPRQPPPATARSRIVAMDMVSASVVGVSGQCSAPPRCRRVTTTKLRARADGCPVPC